ncbi:cell division protein FtsA [Facilibium subflavum]|uniref:cell division protein FtsA n=1 Tax=Facilibium subflavum TaxID=2219058 RepID=UPI000E648EDB|nr:cell division protein FtsA [Facilibium subflavum]
MSDVVEKNILCALDIGTSKVVALVAEVNDNDELNIIGMGTQPSKGLKKGVIVNIDATVKAIQKAVQEAEDISGFSIKQAYIGIAGSHIQSFDSHGVVAIEDSEVSATDLERVIDSAKAVPMPADQEILHILYQDFMIDNHNGIKEPLGMSGVRLEAKVHMVTASSSAVQNIKKCVNRCGIKVQDIVLEQLASSYAVLTDDEKELGVCLVDIGAGTTDIAVFVEGAIKHTSVIPIAGSQITSDIAHALRVATDTAERVKIQYGCAMANLVKSDDAIEIPGLADRLARRVPLQTLAGVIEARTEELFGLIYEMLEKNNLLESISAGLVLTGGAAKTKGLAALAEEIFRIPVRIGGPANITGVQDVLHNPVHSTGVGLLMYSQAQMEEDQPIYDELEGESGVWQKMKGWFGKHF